MSYSPVEDVYALPSEHGSRRNELELTPEEIRVLRECSREGIITRAVPMGFMGGIIGMIGATAGPLMSTKFGVKPAVIGLGLVGYFMGRFSYSKVCFHRALQVPNGALRKFYDQRNEAKEYGAESPAEKYYTAVEPSHDSEYSSPISRSQFNSDIGMQSTSSFDTTPSEYYKENVEAQPQEGPPPNYTSYDDLRRQNREEYSKRMYSDTVRRTYPQEGLARRPPPPQAQPSDQPGGARTKYGDVWDA